MQEKNLTAKKTKLKKKFKIFFVLYFTLFTSFFAANTFAKYYGQVNGNGNVSLAKWDVSIDTPDSDSRIDLIAGNTTDSYNLNITSNSDTKTDYTIVISNLPNNMKVSFDGGTSFQTPSNNIVTFSGTINANAAVKTVNYNLVFDAPIGVNPETYNASIDVLFSQAQPGSGG